MVVISVMEVLSQWSRHNGLTKSVLAQWCDDSHSGLVGVVLWHLPEHSTIARVLLGDLYLRMETRKSMLPSTSHMAFLF